MGFDLYFIQFINEYFVIFYALLAFILIYIFDKKRLLDFVIAVSLSGLLAEGIKYIVNSPRPIPLNSNYVFEGSSFPSSHTSLAFSIYFFYLFCVTVNRNKFQKFLRKIKLISTKSDAKNVIQIGEESLKSSNHLKILNMFAIVIFLILSIFVAYLRIFTQAHFFIDIIAGIIVGFISTLPFVYYDIAGRRIQ